MNVYRARIYRADQTYDKRDQIMVMTNRAETGLHDDNDAMDHHVAQYADGDDRVKILTEAGWNVTGRIEKKGDHMAVNVEPHDWIKIIKAVAARRKEVAFEAARSEYAFRAVVSDAMNTENTVKIDIAEAAGISRERAYQIRDSRR